MSAVRKIEFPLRACPVCHLEIPRWRRPAGKLETPAEYARKETCSPRCAGVMRRKRVAGRPKIRRHCSNPRCGKLLVRKRWASGRIEDYRRFLLRSTCGLACRWDEVRSREKAPALNVTCTRCWKRPSRGDDIVCGYCSRLRRYAAEMKARQDAAKAEALRLRRKLRLFQEVEGIAI